MRTLITIACEMKKVLEHLKYDNNNPKNNKSKIKNNVRSDWEPVPGFKNAIQLSRKPITTDRPTSSAAITNIENCVWQMHLLLHSRHDFRSLIGVTKGGLHQPYLILYLAK